ncbi:MAG: NAD-dependent epimerase/dehydratase family protein [Elusimicrobia bacterium]|nr:NAD-dependent epimerase/dehydratase family protein [Elusimicrobiota bacterium]
MSASGGTVLVTGAAGFIGSSLARELVRRGRPARLVDDLSHGHMENLLEGGKPVAPFSRLDVRDPALEGLMEGVDTVFHLAAVSALPVCQSRPREAYDINVGGTVAVLEAARRAGVRRVVFASTSAVYESNHDFPCREDDPVRPTLVYAMTKKAAEEACLGYHAAYGLETVVTRYYNVYGPNQDMLRKSPAFVSYVVRELLAGRRPALHSDGEQRRDYVFIDDVVALNLLCMEHPAAPGGVFNVASGDAWSVREIYRVVQEATGSSLEAEYRPAARFWEAYPELSAGKHPLSAGRLEAEVNKFTLGSVFKTRDLLGWTARTGLKDGMARTVAHARGVLK